MSCGRYGRFGCYVCAHRFLRLDTRTASCRSIYKISAAHLFVCLPRVDMKPWGLQSQPPSATSYQSHTGIYYNVPCLFDTLTALYPRTWRSRWASCRAASVDFSFSAAPSAGGLGRPVTRLASLPRIALRVCSTPTEAVGKLSEELRD